MPLEPLQLLHHLYAQALNAVSPAQALPPYLAEQRDGRLLVLGAGKAATASTTTTPTTTSRHWMR